MAFSITAKFLLVAAVAALPATSVVAQAETHTVHFDNQCGHGSPVLLQAGDILSNGQDYTSNGPLSSAIAYLQTGPCLLNGENCAIVEMTLGNPHCAGCGSSVDISLIAPHALNVPTAFSFFNGCDGQGATCVTPDCSTAFFNPNDNQVQVACQANNVDLLITFCPGGVNSTSATAVPASPSPSHSPSSIHSTPLSAPSSAAAVSSPSPSPTPSASTHTVATSTPLSSATPSAAAPSSASSSQSTSATSTSIHSDPAQIPSPTPSASPSSAVHAASPSPQSDIASTPSASPSIAPPATPTPSKSTCSSRKKKRDVNGTLYARGLYDKRIRSIAKHNARAMALRRSHTDEELA